MIVYDIANMSSSEIKDKQGETINEGDHVWTKIRGGRREGDVEQIVETTSEAKEAGVKNPPKVGWRVFSYHFCW